VHPVLVSPVVRFLRSDLLCFCALNTDLFAAKEGTFLHLDVKRPENSSSKERE